MRDSPLAAGDLQSRAVGMWRWVETSLLTAAVPAVWFVAEAEGWFGGGVGAGSFPWWVFVPLAIGVQHGLECAFASLVGIAAVGLARALWVGGPLPVDADAVWELWVGGPLPPLGADVAWGVVVLIATRACDAQRERCERLGQRVVQLEIASERERRARRVLQLSHEKLEEQLAGAQHSVEAALKSVVDRVRPLRSAAEFGRLVLDVLAQHASVTEASVWVSGEGELELIAACGARELRAVGRIGSAASLSSISFPRSASRSSSSSVASVVIQRALAERGVVMRLERTTEEPGAARDEPLAAVPLIATDGAVSGVVAIERMEFSAFRADGLRRVEVLVSALMAEVDIETWRMWVAAASGGRADQGTAAKSGSGARAWDAIG
jgi:polysaccharide biosynthesis protein PelD